MLNKQELSIIIKTPRRNYLTHSNMVQQGKWIQTINTKIYPYNEYLHYKHKNKFMFIVNDVTAVCCNKSWCKLPEDGYNAKQVGAK
jgi:hypothetical protein